MIPRLPKGFTHPMPIGKGAFSSVYRVRQSALDRWVAIKVLSEKSPVRRGELLKEAKKQAQLGVPGIPAIYDAFEWRGRICIVMQWIKGVTLDVLLERGIPAALRGPLATSMVAVLAGFHRLGYAHRDLKPANILVSPEEGLFLIDFGFARKVDNPNQSMTDLIIGTPAYMAPELWQPDATIDYLRADLYSLGKILRRFGLDGPWKPVVESLVLEDPAGRPASAVSIWKELENHPGSEAACDWKALAGGISAENLAGQLIQAAKSLIFAKREEEAYWLAVECLEVDPDSAEALRLMDQFPAISRRKHRVRRLWKAALAAGFALAVGGAYLLGRQSGHVVHEVAGPGAPGSKAFLLPVGPGKAGARPAPPLRELAGKGGLSGKLTLTDAPACDSLRLDGRLIPHEKAAEGFAVVAGEHVLSCRCADAGREATRRERFSLLPFQHKVMRICPAVRTAERSGE